MPALKPIVGLILLAGAAPPFPSAAEVESIQFSRDIRPILSDNCFVCHGPDQETRKAKLRLDTREGAVADRGGYQAVVPGDVAKSALIARIQASDPDDLMPPPKSGKVLTPEQIHTLTEWIAAGAAWQEHWAFVPPQRVALPEMTWFGNPIDYFIRQRMTTAGLTPSKEASKETLIRRVTLSLTGLPPTPEEVQAFLADDSPDAYERVVDRLLASPRYGEHMARYWLDAARYGDTHGLHLDNERSIWPYRDWVVRAFNENKPFDQFTVEQLAGDLLPEPAREQLVATGFNRCNVTTSEGGAIPEEFAVRYAIDRVETMSTVWMGLTVGCAVCHDHKFDPISQKEFYQLFDFFNDFDENPMDGNALLPPPTLRLATAEQENRLAGFEDQIRMLEAVLRSALGQITYQDPWTAEAVENLEAEEFVWVEDGVPAGAKASDGDNAWEYVTRREGPVFSGSKASVRRAEKTGQHFFDNAPAPLLVGKGDRLFAHVYLDPVNPPQEIMLQFNDGNWNHRAFWGEDLIEFGKKDSPERRRLGPLPELGKWVRLEVEPDQVGFRPGAQIRGWAFAQHGGRVYWDKAGVVSRLPQAGQGFVSLRAWDRFQRELEKPDLPDPVRQIVREDPAQRTDEQKKQLQDYFLEYVYANTRAVFDPLHRQRDSLKRERDEFDRAIPRTLITREAKEPRPTHVLKRGEYDKPGDLVHAMVPAVLPPFPEDQPTNRLGLARWLVNTNHPLTARVTVNRFWQQHFGVGLVRTAEDFGSQGERPSHPELLDWLATEFMLRGWDVKHLQRLLVTSAAFRQDSAATPEQLEKDPQNRLFSRGPAFRLDAEVIRDSLLAASGLLVETMGGPGVKPYQPAGIWEAVAYPTSSTAKYRQDAEDALYRRAIYTFWKRTAPPPVITTLDAPNRESCRVRRERTNTPLQALALLNDVQAVEAARHLALRMLREGGDSCETRMAYGFRLATARLPDAREKEILQDLFQTHLADYTQDLAAAAQLLHVGDSGLDESLVTPELAAYTIVANTLLNLSEVITQN